MSINFNSLVTAKNKSVILFLYQYEFCTCNHLLTFSVTMSSLPHLFPLMTSLQAPKRCNSEGARSGLCGVWGRTVHPSFVIVFCVFKLVCCCGLSCWKRISAPFWWDRTPEMLLRGFESLNVQVWVIGLSTWHNAYRSHPLCIPKNSGHDLPAEGISLNFFFREVGWCHFIAFLCAVDGPYFIPSDDPLQKAFTLRHPTGEHIWTLCTVV